MILQVPESDIFEGVGVHFVSLTHTVGFGQTLERIGRTFRDFMTNLDNCHDYFKNTFPKMRSPSFFIADEDEGGMYVEIEF